MLKRLTVILCLVTLVFVSACSSATPVPTTPTPAPAAPAAVTLTFWHTFSQDGSENKTFNEVLIPAFQKKYPHITIKPVVQPYDGLHDSLVTAAAGGTTPDLMRMDIIWTPEFAKIGALEQLDAMPGFADLKAAVFPGPLATNAYKGKYYGLPMDTNTQIFAYHADFLKEAGLSAPPKTMDEFKKYAATFKGQANKFAFAAGGAYPWAMLPLFWSLGGNVTNGDNTMASGFLNSAASVTALQDIVDMQANDAWATTHLGGQPSTWDGYKAGQYGTLLEGPWFFAIMGGDMKGKMVGAPVPAGKGGSISVVGGENIVMFKSTKNKDAAWLFIQYMLTDEAQIAMAKTGQMPVTKTASASPVMKESGYYDPYIEQLKTAKPRTPVPTWNQIDDILSKAFESVLRLKETPKAALDKAAAAIDPLLK